MNTPDERACYVEGLRILAQVLEDHPEVPLPFQGSDGHSPLIFGFHGGGDEEARSAMAAAVRVLPCSFTKAPTDKWLNLDGQLGGLHIELYAAREAVCTRRVVGVEEQEVEEVITPAVIRKVTKPVEVVEWDCAPVLGGAIKREPPAPEDDERRPDLGDHWKSEAERAGVTPKFCMTHDGYYWHCWDRCPACDTEDAELPQAPAPTCLSCGAASNLAVRHVPARTGIAARDEHYCEDLAACAGRRAGHLTATSTGAAGQ